MDALRFDRLTRALAVGATPRRGALRLLSGGLLGLLAGQGPDTAVAHNALAKCKKIQDKKKRKKCVTKAKKHNAGHNNEPQPECTTGEECDDGQFCNGAETCGADGACQPGEPPSCDDGIACTVDACDEGSDACLHTPDDGLCGSNEVCNPEQGCVCQSGFEPCGGTCVQLGASCDTGEPGVCASGTLVCNGTAVICQRTQEPTAETCNGLDDDCDGLIDEGAICPPGQACLPQQGGCRCTGGETTCGSVCCPVQSPQSCGTNGQCGAGATCQRYGSETVCLPAGCVNATTRQTEGRCNGNGQCASLGTVSCGPHMCELGSCRNPCADDTHCVSSHYCAADGRCLSRQANGASCDRARQCSSNICQDGFCCASTCSGGLSCSATGTCACDPFVRCGAQCACETGTCSPAGICIG